MLIPHRTFTNVKSFLPGLTNLQGHITVSPVFTGFLFDFAGCCRVSRIQQSNPHDVLGHFPQANTQPPQVLLSSPLADAHGYETSLHRNSKLCWPELFNMKDWDLHESPWLQVHNVLKDTVLPHC